MNNAREILVDDFELDADGGLPHRWMALLDRQFVPLDEAFMRPDERFFIVEEDGNKALRVFSKGESVSIMLQNRDDGINWSIDKNPVLSWDWRALQIPETAREDVERLNDSAAAVYVIFKMSGLLVKRPVTIKYVYSSTLPVGTEVSYGKLKVVVATSAVDITGDWVHVERNVAEDYRRLFGDDPPNRPLFLRLWSDSDNTGDAAEADFDNFALLSEQR